jgi:DNA-binding transcriptional regulator YhcF (GntR family)
MSDADIIAPAGMGLTERQRDALVMVTTHVGLHGVMPSRRVLAAEMGCSPNNANRLVQGLVERGELNSLTRGGPLTGFGGGGIFVSVPPDIAALLAQFCSLHGEKLQHVVADAIALHLDQLGGVSE